MFNLDICKDSIIIAGDSWGVGEFSEDGESRIGSDKVSHSGLQHYFEEHNQTILNLSKPGGSNVESFLRCANFIENNPRLQNRIKSIIVFQTEWVRDVMDGWHIHECLESSLEDLKSQWVSRFYSRFSALSQKYNIPVYIIGGCSDTLWLDNMHIEYPGVQIVCQSLTNLLVDGNHRIEQPTLVSCQYHLLEKIILLKNNKISDSDKLLLINESTASKNRIKIWRSQKYWFYPDGIHPNREGYKKLFEHLCTQETLSIN